MGPDPNYCPPHDPVTCLDGEVLCPGGGNTYDNCPMPDYCLASWGDCPAICYPPPCNYDAVSIGVTMDMIQMVAGWVLIVQQNALILRACIPKYPLLEEVDPIFILSSRLFYFV